MLYILQNFHYFLILIGPLVFFHELGHFLVAKWCGVRVLKFSLGFGPKIFGFKKGGTEYVLSAIPLGGYVKMWGEDPQVEMTKEDQLVSFSHQPLLKRAAIVAAGPVANFLLAFFVYAIIFLFPIPDAPPSIGLVLADGPAAQAGILPGDQVMAVDGKKISYWSELHQYLQQSNKPFTLQIKRGTDFLYPIVTPQVQEESDELGQPTSKGRIGIALSELLPMVDIPEKDSPAAHAGLQTGDRIKKIGDFEIVRYAQIQNAFSREIARTPNQPIGIIYERGGKDFSTSLVLTQTGSSLDVREKPIRPDPVGYYSGLSSYDVRIQQVEKESVAEKIGLQPGDRLIRIQNKPITSWNLDFAQLGRAKTDSIIIQFVREKEIKEVVLDKSLLSAPNKTFGAKNDPNVLFTPSLMRQYSLLSGIRTGLEKTVEMTFLTIKGLWLMVSGKIALSQVGGPVMLFVVAEKSATQGLFAFLGMMSIISINLGVMNLLPVPVLDGGHLGFMLAEWLRRRPLPIHYREYANLAGIFLLLMLMLVAFHNDFVRFILG